MRIVGGRHRGRPLEVPPGRDIRPTADRTREALFNILEHGRFAASGSPFAGKPVLDVFAGTGALGLEALSRGASHASFIELSPKCVAGNVARLGETQRSRILQVDGTRPPPAPEAMSVVFLDPPYGAGLGAPALSALRDNGWFAARALAVLEVQAREAFAAPQGFAIADERRYGAARLIFLSVEAA
jgi:16S rRNA (guanine966-N2)-methyltransferase